VGRATVRPRAVDAPLAALVRRSPLGLRVGHGNARVNRSAYRRFKPHRPKAPVLRPRRRWCPFQRHCAERRHAGRLELNLHHPQQAAQRVPIVLLFPELPQRAVGVLELPRCLLRLVVVRRLDAPSWRPPVTATAVKGDGARPTTESLFATTVAEYMPNPSGSCKVPAPRPD
jgi:hypothetical protein